ncbi:hypothetical protein NS115_01145 [Paenibacillus jamilae]|uniref:Uncharacterized protein n=1 Tax=Paenibacillus jamilae TaxID=114136 RepID=A0ACC5A0Q2_9BACL|nr:MULTISPECIES: TniQ family protein [Paenibacillus]AUO07087.1 hypothetical protein C0638_11315 [Paenibacillus sp. lzh-N1]KTS85115.1 hypothetical protein NS115_01145 [Paenibacillus jamilae]
MKINQLLGMEEFHRMKLSLYPDESVYSICARYYLYTGHFARLAKIKRNNKLYSSLQNAFLLMSPVSLPVGSRWVRDSYFLEKHSAYPYFSHFILNPEHRKRFKRSILEGDPYILEKRLHPDHGRKLRLCPICVDEEVNKYGEPYWHRSHQLPGSIVCHIHNVLLVSECPICKESLADRNDPLPKVLPLFCSRGHSLHCTRSNRNKDFLTIANNNWLLLHMQRAIRFTRIRKTMFYFLKRDKVEQTHSFYTTIMYSKFLNRFGEETLSQIGLSDQDIVLPSLLGEEALINPLIYIIYMIYFSGSTDEFIKFNIN